MQENNRYIPIKNEIRSTKKNVAQIRRLRIQILYKYVVQKFLKFLKREIQEYLILHYLYFI